MPPIPTNMYSSMVKLYATDFIYSIYKIGAWKRFTHLGSGDLGVPGFGVRSQGPTGAGSETGKKELV